MLLGILGREQALAKYSAVIPVAQDPLTGPGGTNLSPEAFEDAARKASYDRGDLRIQVKAPLQGYGQYFNITNTCAAVAVNRLGLNNVRVQLDYARLAGPADGFLGLGCRMPDPVNGDGYSFNVGPGDGYYVIYRLRGEYTTLAGGGTASSPLVRTGDAPSRLRTECVGDRLALYVNGPNLAI